MQWTNYDDIQYRWVGGGFPTDETLVTTLIGDAEDTIRSAFPTIQNRIDSEELPLARVNKVVAKMVIRHLRNPQGHRATTQGAGPFQHQVTFGGDEPGAMYLTADERAELAPRSSMAGKAFSVDITPAAYNYYAPDVWSPVQ